MNKMGFLLVLLLLLANCKGGGNLTAENISAGLDRNAFEPAAAHSAESDDGITAEITDFSLAVLEKLNGGGNIVISPLSVISALSVAANGAENETLSQMEAAFGTDTGSLNEYLRAYNAYLPSGNRCRVSLANSVWFRDAETLKVDEGFLQTCRGYYDADVYKAPFDESTKNDINAWVAKKTGGQINQLLEEAPSKDAVLYLINALSFDAQWQTAYRESSIREGTFSTESGGKKTVDFMYSTESAFIELPNSIGFSKPYADYKYSFVALLPDEGLTAADLTASLDGKTLLEAVKNQSAEEVETSMPKFSFEFDTELSPVLKALGIRDAFDAGLAEFGALGQSGAGDLFINRVLHKTKIAVDEKRTKAAAAAAVEIHASSAAPSTVPRVVDLDRPFFFMIVDNVYHLPVMMGVLSDIV